MSRSDFFKKFDEHTLVKLKVWENYVKEWLPVFLNQEWVKCINIVDLFSGPGKTESGQEGSPLVAIKTLTEKYASKLDHDLKSIKFFFNDINTVYYNKLKDRILEIELNKKIKCELFNLNFNDCYQKIKPNLTIPGVANLIFIDPFGTDPDDDFIIDVAKTPLTDFLLFVPSNYILRFGDKKIRDSAKNMNDKNASSITRAVGKYYQDKISQQVSNYYLWQFSLKEDGQYYGIIFGSAHPLGIEKFISVSWSIDKMRGEASYDIDDDRISEEVKSLFSEFDTPKKILDFQQLLNYSILSNKDITDTDVALLTLRNGMQSKHARDVYENLVSTGALPKKKGLIFDSRSIYKKSHVRNRLFN